jgi:hypothetical protein
MILPLRTGIGLWRTGSMFYDQMRLKSTAWGQMEGSGCGSGREKDFQIGQCRGRRNLEEGLYDVGVHAVGRSWDGLPD